MNPFSRLSENTTLAWLIGILLLARLALYALVAGGLPVLPHDLCHWDCTWYIRTAREGYDLAPQTDPYIYAQANWAFFPVFPALTRMAVWLAGVPYDVGGFLVANLAFAAFIFLAAKFTRLVDPQLNRTALIVFLIAFPYGFYCSLGYSESIYAALATGVFYLMRRGTPGFAESMLCGVLTATRVTGILLVPVLMLRRLLPVAAALRAGEGAPAGRLAADSILPVALMPLGLFCYMAFLYWRMGDALAFLHVQTAWMRSEGFPLYTLMSNFKHFDLNLMLSRTRQCIFFAEWCAIGGIAVAIWLAVRQRYAEAWFLFASIMLALSAGTVSLPRYILTNPILLVTLFELFWRSPLRRAFVPVIAGFAVFQLYLVHLWTLVYAALY
jgi:hypothetical protein